MSEQVISTDIQTEHYYGRLCPAGVAIYHRQRGGGEGDEPYSGEAVVNFTPAEALQFAKDVLAQADALEAAQRAQDDLFEALSEELLAEFHPLYREHYEEQAHGSLGSVEMALQRALQHAFINLSLRDASQVNIWKNRAVRADTLGHESALFWRYVQTHHCSQLYEQYAQQGKVNAPSEHSQVPGLA